MAGISLDLRVRALLMAALLLGAACGDDDSHDVDQNDAGDDAGDDMGGSGSGGSDSNAGSGGNGGTGGDDGEPTGQPDGGTAEDAGQPEDAGDSGTDANTQDTGSTDPCEDVQDPCEDEGTSCDGDTLVTCDENEDGCLVETRTDCDDGDTDFCDEDADPPACAADPCAGVANACDTAGTTCDDLTLVTCALNDDGCLVATETDCTAGANNACTGSAGSAACSYEACREDDGTPKEAVCVVAETMCAEDVLIECVDDGEGCLIATPTDCTTEPNFNYCDADAETPACAYDPCIGVTDCLTAGTICRGTDLVTCAADGQGCLVETVEDCTQDGTVNETCDDTDGTPECVTCVPDPACATAAEGDTTCNGGNTFATCTDTDGDSCLNLVSEVCGDDFTCDDDNGCEYTGDAECDDDIELVLRAPGSFGPFDTAGAGSQFTNYMCPGISELIPFMAQGPDLLFALEAPAGQVTTVTLTTPTGFTNGGAFIMLLSSCEDGSATAESTCEAIAGSSVSFANEGTTTARVYVTVDADGANNDGTFGLEVDTHPLGCGDGLLDGSEECDDGNIFADDGCTPACELEEGYECTAASPSICTRRPDDEICGNVMCDPLPDNAPQGAEVCCTPSQQCGVAYPLLYGASCIERDQEGADSDTCPDEPSVFLFSTLQGCCRPDDTCGLRTSTGGGCVERTVMWQNMQDGFGELLYTGPFEEVDCDFVAD